MFNRVCTKISQFLLVWVIAAVAVGYAFPGLLTWVKPYIDWLFALTMLGIGMVTRPADYKPILKNPASLSLGMLAQFAIMPVSAFLTAKLLRLPPELALGLILAGATPDAMAAGVVSYAAHADVAYAIAFTCLSTLIAPFFTPAFTYVFGRVYVPVPFWPMVASILKMVIVPLLLGLTLKHFLKSKIDRIEAFFPALSSIFIACICGLVVALNRAYILELTWLIFAAVVILNAAGLVLGYQAGKLFGFDERRRRTLAICVGMQNAGLGAVLAIKHFGAQAAVPNALFATWCIVSASIVAWYWNRTSPAEAFTFQEKSTIT